jgi:hypothetical protein
MKARRMAVVMVVPLQGRERREVLLVVVSGVERILPPSMGELCFALLLAVVVWQIWFVILLRLRRCSDEDFLSILQMSALLQII